MSVPPNVPPKEETPEALQAKIAQLESEKTNLVEELKNDRTKSRTALEAKETELANAQELLKAAVEKNNSVPSEEERIANIVKSVLSAKDKEVAVGNKKAAFDKFVNENPEYHPDNDVGGLKRSALEKEFNGFNTAGIVEVDDFVAVVGKADRLLRETDTSRQTQHIPSSPPPNNAPRQTPTEKVTAQERELIARNGWTEEGYLKLKEKNPSLVSDLTKPFNG